MHNYHLCHHHTTTLPHHPHHTTTSHPPHLTSTQLSKNTHHTTPFKSERNKDSQIGPQKQLKGIHPTDKKQITRPPATTRIHQLKYIRERTSIWPEGGRRYLWRDARRCLHGILRGAAPRKPFSQMSRGLRHRRHVLGPPPAGGGTDWSVCPVSCLHLSCISPATRSSYVKRTYVAHDAFGGGRT